MVKPPIPAYVVDAPTSSGGGFLVLFLLLVFVLYKLRN